MTADAMARPDPGGRAPRSAAAGITPLWWHPGGDTLDGQQIDCIDVAATGTSSPVPPGIPQDPGPGQYYASPALAALLRSTPADRLVSRYPGRMACTIGDAALPSPNSLEGVRRYPGCRPDRRVGALQGQLSLLHVYLDGSDAVPLTAICR